MGRRARTGGGSQVAEYVSRPVFPPMGTVMGADLSPARLCRHPLGRCVRKSRSTKSPQNQCDRELGMIKSMLCPRRRPGLAFRVSCTKRSCSPNVICPNTCLGISGIAHTTLPKGKDTTGHDVGASPGWSHLLSLCSRSSGSLCQSRRATV